MWFLSTPCSRDLLWLNFYAVTRNPKKSRLPVTSLPSPDMLCTAWSGLSMIVLLHLDLALLIACAQENCKRPFLSSTAAAEHVGSSSSNSGPWADLFQTSTWTVLNDLTDTRQCLSYRPLHGQPLLKTVFGRGLVADTHELNHRFAAICGWRDAGSLFLCLVAT